MSRTTRDRIIKTAHDMFYRVGFHTVGLDAILAEVGVTKTTFYNHFESKDDLVHETLRWHDRWWQDTFREVLRKHGGDTARGQLLAIFDALDELLACDDFNGCYFVNVAVQFPTPHDPAHQAAATHKQAMESIIRELAGYAGAQDAGGLASELSLLMEGAYVTRQVTGNHGIGEVASRVAKLVIESHLA
ncbi:MAG: TetR/AcrR family transcriptional regulator [Planctomycetota bacterium]|jgi:AcrR family transcriptional regulator